MLKYLNSVLMRFGWLLVSAVVWLIVVSDVAGRVVLGEQVPCRPTLVSTESMALLSRIVVGVYGSCWKMIIVG